MKKVILLVLVSVIILAGCKKTQGRTVLQEAQVENILQIVDVESYLALEIGTTGFNGVTFCAYDIISAEQDVQQVVTYLWVLCQEYYQEQRALELGTGTSLPVAVFIEKNNDNFSLLNCKFPRDGMSYEQEVRDIFPKSIWAKINPSNESEVDAFNKRIRNLEDILKVKAEEYFKSNE